jgi:signal transduction histidine kinase
MNETGLVQVYFLVFFIYGLAFFGMGLAMALESGRSPSAAEGRVLLLLATFGVIHGAHEWLESYLLQAAALGMPLPVWVPGTRLALLVTSFSCLLLFAYYLLRLTPHRFFKTRVIHFGLFPIYILGILISSFIAIRQTDIQWFPFLDGLTRYLLAAPAALMAAIALRARARQAQAEKHHQLGQYYSSASLGFGIYTFTQIFVHPMNVFPASLLNMESFLELTGIPIQGIRSLAAVLITYSLLRAAQVGEKLRNLDLAAAQQARLEALQQQEALRRELLRHIVQAQEDERARIARELHDETAQILSAFALEVGALRNILGRKTDSAPTLDRLQDLNRQMSQGVYRMVHALRPAQLDDLGLIPALKSLLEQECSPKGMKVDFKVEGAQHRLDPLIETVLFRVAQEGLINVARHAGTHQAEVWLRYEDNQIRLQILDQGCGFDPAENFHPPRGWGLAGMRERVEAVGGRLNLESQPGMGSKVEIVIPLFKREKEQDKYENHLIDAGR